MQESKREAPLSEITSLSSNDTTAMRQKTIKPYYQKHENLKKKKSNLHKTKEYKKAVPAGVFGCHS